MITNEWLKSNIVGYLPKLSLDSTLKERRYLLSDKYRVQASDADKKIGDRASRIKPSPHSLLIDILNNPFSSITTRYKTLSLNPKYGNKYKNDLVAQGLIKQQKITTSKGWITLFDITPRGRAILRDLGCSPTEATEGIVHKFWKHRIAEFYKAQNLKVDVEKGINGRPDIIVSNGSRKVAIEIETGKSNAVDNIERDVMAGFDETICVATSKIVEEKIKALVVSRSKISNKVKVTCAAAFDHHLS